MSGDWLNGEFEDLAFLGTEPVTLVSASGQRDPLDPLFDSESALVEFVTKAAR